MQHGWMHSERQSMLWLIPHPSLSCSSCVPPPCPLLGESPVSSCTQWHHGTFPLRSTSTVWSFGEG